MALTLVSFGNPRLIDENGVAIAFPEKGLLAAGYISTRPRRSVARTELAAFLWGEDASNPLVNLRQLLSRVKARQQEIGVTLLDTRDNQVVVPANGVECDFLLLKALAADRPLDVLEKSLAYVTGPFFAGIGASSDRAELWLTAQQEQVLSRFAQALEALTHHDGPPAHEHMQKQAAYRLLEFDPYNEIAYRILINAFTSEGNFAQARAMFDRYSTRLRKDLNARPEGAMLAIRDRVARQAMERLPAALAAERLPTGAISPSTGLPRVMLMPPPSSNAQVAGLLATSLLEDVTISLCRARSIQLVAPHTARRIAIMDETGRQEAYRNCNVSYVLETRFAPGTEADALFASLVNVSEDAIVWAERLPVDPSGLGTTYNTIVRRVAAVALSQIERHEFSRISRTTTPTAYQNFLIGKHYVRNMKLPDIRRARKAFRETLKEMPDFAPALGGLSRTAHLEWLVTARGDIDLLKLSEKHAQAAIDADGDDSDGFHQLGVSRLYRGAFDESIELFEIAERNAPSHADLIADHADTLVHASRIEEALAKINLAFELNPFAPDYYWWTTAGANYSLHRYEVAIENLTHVADQTNVLRFNAACWAMLGDTRKARAYMRRTMENFPDFETDKWLALIPIRDPAQREQYREGLRRAGFK
ncbi:MAG: DNA-binding protein [Rhizobium sp.]|nr:DNA-binding protein [Rhizobium sp.]